MHGLNHHHAARELDMVRKNSGFSMMELMVVIGIIGLLAAIAMPNMIDWLSKRKQSTSTRDVHSTIELARMTAVRRNGTATVTVAASSVAFTITANGVTTPGRTTRIAAGVTLTREGTFPASFTFNSQGIPSATGTLLIRDNKHKRLQVEISSGGNVRITQGSAV
jgi:type IV fimbrial biogenesis protein FimT